MSFLFNTNALIGVVPNLKRPQKFLLDRFFPNMVMSDSEFVSIDVDVGLRRMSPFVSPLVQGKLVEQRRLQTNQFKPAYIKDKRAPDLRKPVKRMIGERIGGELTGAAREAANLEAEMSDQVDMIDRRLEWMAASALMTGTVLIVGDGFPAVLVDFGRDAALSLALTGADKWDTAFQAVGANGIYTAPSDSIEEWGHVILKKSGGTAADLIFTTTSWKYFKLDSNVKTSLHYPRSGEGNNVNIGAQVQRGAQYKGKWGQYDLWVYNDWYIDESGVERAMVDDGKVIMSGPDLMGTRAFGQILDPAVNYAALPYAPKTWVENDPAQRLIMMQSSPIVIPSRVNASLCATVATPKVF